MATALSLARCFIQDGLEFSYKKDGDRHVFDEGKLEEAYRLKPVTRDQLRRPTWAGSDR